MTHQALHRGQLAQGRGWEQLEPAAGPIGEQRGHRLEARLVVRAEQLHQREHHRRQEVRLTKHG